MVVRKKRANKFAHREFADELGKRENKKKNQAGAETMRPIDEGAGCGALA